MNVQPTNWLLRSRVLDGLGYLMPLSHEKSSVSIAPPTFLGLKDNLLIGKWPNSGGPDLGRPQVALQIESFLVQIHIM